MSTRRKKDTTANKDEQQTSDIELDLCSCPPVSPLCLPSAGEYGNEEQEWDDEKHGQVLPTPFALNALLRTRLQTLLPSVSSVSVLLLHVSQFEHVHITPTTEVVHKRRRYHPATSVVEQVLTNVRRAIRMEDGVYIDGGRGAAILFPHVNQEGAYIILERVFNSVSLLQAETIIPPLTHETDIVLGIGSYPEQGPSLEQVLACAGRVTHRLTLRPAISMHLWDAMPLGDSAASFHDTFDDIIQDDAYTQQKQDPRVKTHIHSSAPASAPLHDATPVPFLQLPITLSARLKNLLSYKVAVQFRCIPMGRDHNRLTLAMADPTDAQAVHALHNLTGLSIFPVACDNDALDRLLAEQW